MRAEFQLRCNGYDIVGRQRDSAAEGETRLEGSERNVDETMRSNSRVFEARSMEQAPA